MPQFFGKYAGTVTDNFDPNGKGRLLVKVPAVFCNGDVWATPCVPYAGDNIGFFAMPPKDSHVWIEFEAGDPGCPIWSGCFWKEDNKAPVSVSPLAEKQKMLKTERCTLLLDDSLGGGIKIEFGRFKIEIKDDGIEITTGQGATVKLSGSRVTINNGALEVQ